MVLFGPLAAKGGIALVRLNSAGDGLDVTVGEDVDSAENELALS
jgi:hypothetical protein